MRSRDRTNSSLPSGRPVCVVARRVARSDSASPSARNPRQRNQGQPACFRTGAASLTETYQYNDPANRLSAASESGSGCSQTYGYDAFGNRTVEDGGQTERYLAQSTRTPGSERDS